MTFQENINRLNAIEFKILFNSGKRKSTIFEIDFESLIYSSYWLVKHTVPNLIHGYEYEKLIIELVRDRGVFIDHTDVNKSNYNDLLAFVFWVADELKLISDLETRYLSAPPEPDMVSAGIHELNELGELNVIDSLANGDILKWEEVKKIPYCTVFDKLRKSVKEREIQKRLNSIQAQRNKQKTPK